MTIAEKPPFLDCLTWDQFVEELKGRSSITTFEQAVIRYPRCLAPLLTESDVKILPSAVLRIVPAL